MLLSSMMERAGEVTEINLFGVADQLPRYPTDQRPAKPPARTKYGPRLISGC